jgi:hypothetical protein
MVHCDIGEQLGEWGRKLYLYSCNGKKVGEFSMYSINLRLLKNPKLTNIDYLEIEYLERNKFDLGATI